MSTSRAKKSKPAAESADAPAGTLRLEWWPVERVMPYAKNAKSHPPAQVALLAQSIEEHGWTQPLVVRSDGDLVAGHGRLEAAKMLGRSQVPVVVRDDLTPEQARALRISDNKLAELGQWDHALLAGELADLRELDVDTTGLGFTDDELKALEAGLAHDLDAIEQPAAPKRAGSVGGPVAKPVVQYQLIFDDEDQQQRFFEFIRSLREVYPDLPSVAARVDAWIKANQGAS